MVVESFQPQFTPFQVAKWVDKLPIPNLIRPTAVGNNNQPWGNKPPALYTSVDPNQVDYHGIAPEFFNRTIAGTTIPYYQVGETLWYDLHIQPSTAQMVQQVVGNGSQPLNTPVVGYNGTVPGPTFKTRVGQPAVVRNYNDATEHYSTHLHGGHNASHADGFPTFVNEPGNYRDYYYANTVPMVNGRPDFGESPSTMWYHDHGVDLTEKHVLEGAVGFWQAFDDLELNLIKNKVIPGWWGKSSNWNEANFFSQNSPFDIPLVLADRRFNADGSVYEDPLNFDGYLGDVQLVNGKAYPTLDVSRTKYRFRILDGANARFYNLQLTDNKGDHPSFIGLGSDTWLYPQAIKRDTLFLSGAQRADVVVDFSKYKAGDVVYLDNILGQTSGRGPNGTPDDPNPVPGDHLLKFVVKGNAVPQADIPKVDVGTRLRPHTKLDPANVTATRIFEFHRSNGHWQINQRDYVPERADASPVSGGVERWILRNSSGGWSHPVHIHLESHQVEMENGHAPRPEDRWKRDTSILTPNGEVSLLLPTRTWTGPFVMHCHILGHEDLMMMINFDPKIQAQPGTDTTISQNFAPPSMNPYVHPNMVNSGAMSTLATTLKLSDDCTHGDESADTLKGTKKNDCLYGVGGNDTITGGKGDDLITGGQGSDTLTGQLGADLFEYDNGDAVTGTVDTITDFRPSDGDQILLFRDMLQPSGTKQKSQWDFVGDQAFSGSIGEIRFSGGLLEGDINGDRIAELSIQLPGLSTFQDQMLMLM